MKKTGLLILVIIVIMSLFIGCSKSDEVGTENKKDTLVFGNKSEPTTFDAHFAGDGTTMGLLVNINETLTDITTDGELIPLLAESWAVSDDGIVYTFNLKKGVTFHNGEEFNADDVKYSFERAMGIPNMASKTNMIESIDIVDDYKINVNLKTPFSPFLKNVAWIFIVNEKAIDEAGDSYSQNPIGTGPYILKEWQSGNKVILERYDGYHNKKANIKNIEIRTIADATTRAMSIESGELDMTVLLNPMEIEPIKSMPDLVILEDYALYYWHLLLNSQKSPFDNVKVRQAMTYAINRDTVNIAANEGKGKPALQPMTAWSFGFTDEVIPLEYNVEMAKKLLKESGYENGFKTQLTASEGHMKLAAEAIQADLKVVGIEADLNIVEWGTQLSNAVNGNYETSIMGWGDVVGDSDGVMRQLFSTETFGESGNYARYSNPIFDKIVQEAKIESDMNKRKELYKQALEIVWEDCPHVPLYFAHNNVVYSKNIQDFRIHPMNAYKFVNFSFK